MSTTEYSGPAVFGYETDGLRRVAFISVHTSPLAVLGRKDAGGMNVYERELAHHLGQLGLSVDIYTRRTDLTSPEISYLAKGVRVINITAGPTESVDKQDLFQHLPEFAKNTALFSLRDGVRYDIVHAHYWLSGWAGHLLRRYWDAPLVQMFHTTAHMKNAVLPQANREPALRARHERMLVDLADAVIAANPDERADLLWRQRTPSDKICTIPPGVDLELFKPEDQSAARRRLGFEQESNIVLFVGRIDPIKGADALVRTMVRLRDETATPPIFAIVGGDLDASGQPVGPLAEIAEEAKRSGVRDQCRFFGSRPQYDLPAFYAAADVVFVPSRYESFGLVAIEAMACARPVVASRAGGLAFTVVPGETGFLAPVGDDRAFADAIATLLADPGMSQRMGEAGQEIANRFGWPSVAAAMLHVYERLCSGFRENFCCLEEIFA